MLILRPAGAGHRIALFGAALLAMTLGSCREQEQERPLLYEKGTYQGQQDRELTADERRALQERVTTQQF